jgi:hypothetical protein
MTATAVTLGEENFCNLRFFANYLFSRQSIQTDA